MKDDNVVLEKSKAFAIKIVRLYKELAEKREFVLSKQLLKSGTSVGANLHEAIYGYSKSDFYAKLTVALKEASETAYWLELLHATDYIDDASYNDLNKDCCELLKLLTSIAKTKDHPN